MKERERERERERRVLGDFPSLSQGSCRRRWIKERGGVMKCVDLIAEEGATWRDAPDVKENLTSSLVV